MTTFYNLLYNLVETESIICDGPDDFSALQGLFN